jgi:hypothetical protein
VEHEDEFEWSVRSRTDEAAGLEIAHGIGGQAVRLSVGDASVTLTPETARLIAGLLLEHSLAAEKPTGEALEAAMMQTGEAVLQAVGALTDPDQMVALLIVGNLTSLQEARIAREVLGSLRSEEGEWTGPHEFTLAQVASALGETHEAAETYLTERAAVADHLAAMAASGGQR